MLSTQLGSSYRCKQPSRNSAHHCSLRYQTLRISSLLGCIAPRVGRFPTSPCDAFPFLTQSWLYIFRRYCPPTSNKAWVICPSEHTRAAFISSAKMLPPSMQTCLSFSSATGASSGCRLWKSRRRSHGPLTHLGRELVCLRHCSIFSKVGASSIPGAVQIDFPVVNSRLAVAASRGEFS